MKKVYLLVFVLFCSGLLTAEAQTGTLKGKVITTDGQPAAFVNVTLVELKKGSVTREDGTFLLKNIKEGQYTLRVSYIGLQTQEKTVVIVAGQIQELNFSLPETSLQLDEVVVDGRKSVNVKPISVGKAPIAPMDLPQSIAVVGQQVIADQQAQRMSDVVKNVNGVYLGTARGSTQETFYARGYSLSGNNLFKNGTRVNSGTIPEVSSLEKVEVLKGSAAILYGNVAPGGIVNMVTKKPRFQQGGEVAFRTGSYDLYKPTFDVYGPLSSKVAYRVNGTYESARSYRDVVHSERYYINPSFLFKLSKRTELLVQGDYLDHQFTPDFGIGSLADTAIAPAARSAFFGTPWQYAKTKQATAGASLKHQLSNAWTLNVTGSYQSYRRDYYAVERIQAAANGDWNRPLGRQWNGEDYYIAQADLTGKFKTGRFEHTLLAGIDADRYMTTNYTFDVNSKTYDKINLLDPNKYVPRTDMPASNKISYTETPTNRVGAYVQDLISVSEKIKVLAGVRWSYQDAPSAKTTNLLKDTVSKGTSKTDKAFSPRFGIVYKPIETMAFFASYANSFTPNTGTDVYNNALSPSIIDQYEAGIKKDFFNGKLSANVTAYRIVNNNLALMAVTLPNGQTNNNTTIKELVGQTTSDGIEVDLSGHPVQGLAVIAGYSYNNMRYTKTPKRNGSYRQGERLVNTPAHTANASIFYTFTGGGLKGLKVGAAAFYVGDRFGGWNNQDGQKQENRLIAVDGFTTLDISAGYTWKKISLLGKLSNLTNAYNYYVHENYSINPIPPRQFVATMSYKF